jgi:hypothetical protein
MRLVGIQRQQSGDTPLGDAFSEPRSVPSALSSRSPSPQPSLPDDGDRPSGILLVADSPTTSFGAMSIRSRYATPTATPRAGSITLPPLREALGKEVTKGRQMDVDG